MFSSPKQLCKRLLSVLLALTFVASPIAVIAEDAIALADAARSSTPLAVVFAASDFQPRRISGTNKTTGEVTYDGGRSIIAGISQMEAIANRVIEAYGADAVTGALFCGDYSNESKYRFEGTDKPYSNGVAITNDGINAVRKVLGNKFNLSSEEIVMIQGNHDFFLTPLATTNAHDTEQYGVYTINEKDFMYKQATLANGIDTVKKTAEDLERYLQAKVAQHYSKPIFIVNHIPLHHNPRAEDNLYAQYLFDVINSAGQQGLTIFYLFGHNHSKGYDAHIGEGSIYLKPGEEIYIPDPASYEAGPKTAGSQKRTLNFSYMTAGYVGYVTTDSSGFADNTLTSTTFAIFEDRVEVRRFDAKGEHVLKAAGKKLSTYESQNLHIYHNVMQRDEIRLDNKYNVSLNTDELYPKTTVTSSVLKDVTFETEVKDANGNSIYDMSSSSNKVTYNESDQPKKSLTLSDAKSFTPGKTGTISIDCVAEKYSISSVTSSNEGVATAVIENGKIKVTGVSAGKTTLTVVAKHDAGVYADVTMTYDLVVFPNSSAVKDLYYTRYKLLNAVPVEKTNSYVSDNGTSVGTQDTGSSIFATSNHAQYTTGVDPKPEYAFVGGESYIFVDTFRAKTRLHSLSDAAYNTEDERWAYAFLNTPTGASTSSSRNVAVYGVGSSKSTTDPGSNASSTTDDKTANVYYNTYVDISDQYMEWIYCANGQGLRNSASGIYVTSNENTTSTTASLAGFSLVKEFPRDVDGDGTNDDFNKWNIGGYGVNIDDNNGSTDAGYKRYMRFDLTDRVFKTELQSDNTAAGGRKDQYSNISIFKKVTYNDNKTGEKAWLDTTKISVIDDNNLDTVTGATMYITDGMNVTPVPVTLNMLYSATTNITSSTSASTTPIATNFVLKYDTVEIASGITLTMRTKPEWDNEANFDVKVGQTIAGKLSTIENLAGAGATGVVYSYQSMNVDCATVSQDGSVTGTGVGGALIRVTATLSYSDGSTAVTTDDVYVTVKPADSCSVIVRTFGKHDVYTLVETSELECGEYDKTTKKTSDAEEFIVVSTNQIGDAFAMQNYAGPMNNLRATPVIVESYNGERFIHTADSSILWEMTQTGGFVTNSSLFGGPDSNKSGWRLPLSNYYQMDSLNAEGLQFLIALLNMDSQAYDGSLDIDCDTNLFCTTGGSSYIAEAINRVFPEKNDQPTKYTDPAAAWNYTQKNVGLAAVNYNPQYTTGGDYFSKQSSEKITYIMTYDPELGEFKADYHPNKWPGEFAAEYTNLGVNYPNRVYLYAKRNIETSGVMIWIGDKNEGTVGYNATDGASTGATINITTHSPEGVSTVSYPLTYGMIEKSNGLTTNVTTDTTYENLTVNYTYGGVEYKVCDKFKLTVANKTDDDPDYPEQGSVNVTKSSDTSKYDYFGTGTSHIDLTVSGIPLSSGIDIVVMVDASTSMQDAPDGGTGESRLRMLYRALVALMNSLKEPDENGKVADVDFAVASFNGQTYINSNHLISPLESICNCSPAHNKIYTHYNALDMSTTNLPFAAVTDPAYDAFISSLQNDITNSKFGKNDCNVKTIKPSSGTNYDRAMELTYDLLIAKQAQNTLRGENRKQYVLFMTDGETWQFNYFGGRNANEKTYRTTGGHDYVYHDKEHVAKWLYVLDGRLDTNGTISNFANTPWKTATGDTTPVVEAEYQDIFKKYYNPDGRHWMAEAIKGSPSQTYKIIDPESTNSDKIEYVNGLGATMYTVSFAIGGADYEYRGLDCDIIEGVVKRMSTNDDHFTAIGTVGGDAAYQALLKSFMQIKNDIKTSGNAEFVDQMGDGFDLQMNSSYTVNNETYTITPPSITLTSYPLYKYWEVGTVVNGVLVTENMVGKRKSDVGTVMEKITFSGTDSNRQAYSNLIGEGKTNILTNGIIQGKNISYNTLTNSVTLNGKTYDPETFYWNIGDVPQDEYVLGYDIYLSGSMEGTAFGGIHYTNEHAELNYTNYLGKEMTKPVQSPTLPWKEAYIGVNFYYVNEDGKPLVNRKTGQTGSFDMAQTLGMEKTQYIKFKLNDTESVEAMARADQYVPVGYKLYDQSAAYSVFASSSPQIAQNWTITKGTDVAVSSTYVTQFSSNVKSSNALKETNSNYSYTNTIVYFAIVASVDCVPDAVVIDYGLPVDIDVMENDVLFTDNATLTAVGATADMPENPEDTEEYRGTYDATKFKSEYNGTYGTASVLNESDIQYKLKSMKMDGIEIFKYVANYTGDLGVNGYYYGDIAIIPATSIYYEDSDEDYVTLTAFEYKKPNNKVNNAWKTVGTTSTDSQSDDRLGDVAANIYGSDEAYDNCTTYSYGSAKKITVKRDSGSDPGLYGTIDFSFKGTGFDVISLTSNKTGTIVVQVFDANEKQVRTSIVDTYYGYKFTGGKWQENASASDVLYQVPVIKMTGFDYGEYTVKISVSYAPIFAHNGATEYDFYLDAIRIYDPAKEDKDVKGSHIKDFEAFPKYDEIRNLLISAKDFNSNVANSEVSGAIFIDGISSLTANTASNVKLNKLLPLEFAWSVPELLYPELKDASKQVSDYAHFGPNNELYLNANQAVAFDFTAPVELQKVHLAVKALKGDTTGTLEVYGYDANNKMTDRVVISTKSATDMYTDITKIISMDEAVASQTTIVIRNTGSSLISITNLKTTYSSDVSTASATVTQATASRAFEVLQMVETPAIYTMHTSKKIAQAGESVNVVLTTSANADYVTINGVKVTDYTENSAGSRIWSTDVVASGDANMIIEALAYNITGEASEAMSADVRIKAAENVEIVTVLGAYIDEVLSGK